MYFRGEETQIVSGRKMFAGMVPCLLIKNDAFIIETACIFAKHEFLYDKQEKSK